MIRLMRGQVVVREVEKKSVIWTPEDKARSVKTHRGTVLGLGPPALNCPMDKLGRCTSLTCKHVEVPYMFGVGDTVQFHYAHHQEAHTRTWPPDGRLATWVPQGSVDAVIE